MNSCEKFCFYLVLKKKSGNLRSHQIHWSSHRFSTGHNGRMVIERYDRGILGHNPPDKNLPKKKPSKPVHVEMAPSARFVRYRGKTNILTALCLEVWWKMNLMEPRLKNSKNSGKIIKSVKITYLLVKINFKTKTHENLHQCLRKSSLEVYNFILS